jgi:protein SCO1/2
MALVRRFGLPVIIMLLAAAAMVWLRGNLGGGDRNPDIVFELGGPFRLTDAGGQEVTQAKWADKLLFLYFGYRFCPDACPTGLQNMASAMDLLGAEADKVQPLFISIDPERDTPETLAAYTGLFHPRLVGLTGTVEQVATVAKAYRVFYRKAPGTDPANYSVDHSTYTYIADGRGKVVKVFSHNSAPEEMAEYLRSALRRSKFQG